MTDEGRCRFNCRTARENFNEGFEAGYVLGWSVWCPEKLKGYNLENQAIINSWGDEPDISFSEAAFRKWQERK